MNIQVALDRLTREECFQILEDTGSYVDWIEIGTGVIKEYGMAIVRDIREKYPDKIIVADMKTCDAGKHETIQALDAGADITTVMAFSADKTITDTLEVAESRGKRVMVDLLGVSENKRIRELQELGVSLVSLHIGKDMQETGESTGSLFDLIQGINGIETAVAGGITLETLPGIVKNSPDTVIIGSAITKAKDPAEAAKAMKGLIRE
ncbi:Fe-S cluster assembly protein HesB [Rossellomorea vietnamensis]|uniref:3-hexulose-6-phosphate synthase n=1 Tax=Rossellomorea vietnamensis TaxID=218284 RepID=A0A6I6UPI1_9BACI|nr:3-hexulose-6-phosphate synthase [Rossellomorea vietnamensis]QHE60420.1 Fe-S cluster assembly protein HesB [Rossellomorea vietnamensis]